MPLAPRRARLLAALIALALLVAACGSEAVEEVSSTPSPSGDDGYPVTIAHLFGETTVEAPPERVVTIGFNEQDFALALGVTPVAVREFIGYDYRARPWAQEALDGADLPEVGGTELNIEAVAAADPDLILGTYAFIEQSTYDQLSQIAPTVGDLEGEPGTQSSASWEDQLEAVGAALGRSDEAAAVAADVREAFDEARAANPGFEGKVLAVDFIFDGGHYVLEPADIRFQFFADLGFEPPPVSGEISAEALDELEADVLVVIGDDRDAVLANPVFAGLDVVTEDRTVFFGPFDGTFPAALGFGSPLSLPYALDLAVPPLAAAADGDPATAVPEA